MTTQSNHKKRILFVITQSEFGGAQRFLYNFVTHLEPESYEIMVAYGIDSLSGQGDGALPDALKEHLITTHALTHLKRDISPKNDILAVRELANLITGFEPDTLFLNSSKAGVIGALASRKFPNLRVIYRIGGWAFNEPMPSYVRKLYLWTEKFTAKYKDIIIVNNSNDLKQAETLGIRPRESVQLVYNGLDLNKLEYMDKDQAKGDLFRKISDFPATAVQEFVEAKYLIGTIANFYKTKGLEYLIEAISMLPPNLPVAMIIIGDGRERDNLKSKIENLKLTNKIFLVGQLSDASRYLPAFDAFVLPSVKEGFPWAILEAMAAKLPVIATNVGAMPEIIESGVNGILVAPRNPSAIAKNLIEILRDDHKRQELGIQAHQTILMKFSLSKMVTQIKNLL